MAYITKLIKFLFFCCVCYHCMVNKDFRNRGVSVLKYWSLLQSQPHRWTQQQIEQQQQQQGSFVDPPQQDHRQYGHFNMVLTVTA